MLFTRWEDIDRTLARMDEVSRRVWGEVEVRRGGAAAGPAMNLYDQGDRLVLLAEVPGLRDADLALTVDRDVLTLAGERKAPAHEGYTVHRQERGHGRFARSIALPVPVDVDHATAAVKNGVLTVTLPKAAEARPRQIAVHAEN